MLGTSLVVMTISAGALHTVRIQSQSGTARDDIAEARLFAASAVEWGRRTIAADPAWRTNYSNGEWTNNLAIGNTNVFPASQGKISLSVVNPSGALNRSEFDSVVLTATGASGVATQKAQVTLAAKKVPYTCLSAALAVGGSLDFNGSNIYGNNQVVASNGNMNTNGWSADIYPNVESAGSITGGDYHGTKQSGLTPRTFPPSSAFDYYIANGTTIPFTSIPVIDGVRRMSNKFILAWNEPFTGRNNSQGIFVVDCNGNPLIIENCFFMATLIILNPGPGTGVYGDVNWYPYVSNLPCLMVRGNLNLITDSWDSGHAQGIYGLVYVSGNADIDDNPAINNLVVEGSLNIRNADLTLSYQPTFTNNAPPGFYTVDMVVSPGTWKQNVN